MAYFNNITKECFPYWSQCPSKIEISKCVSERDCIYHKECFKEWRAQKSPMASIEMIDKWHL